MKMAYNGHVADKLLMGGEIEQKAIPDASNGKVTKKNEDPRLIETRLFSAFLFAGDVELALFDRCNDGLSEGLSVFFLDDNRDAGTVHLNEGGISMPCLD
jgi:hypothetical protein